jgi:anti-sigma B factor antagonist
MTVETEKYAENQAVVRPQGRVDASTADDLRQYLKETLQNDVRHLVVDMIQVDFIDSSGLGALVSGFKAARENHGSFVLANVGRQVRIALELTRLNQVFTVHEDVETAFASMATRSP